MSKVIAFERQKRPDLAAPVIVDSGLVEPAGPDMFASLDQALTTAGPFDAAVVAVNEDAHHQVLTRLADTDIATILCEKPLTATLAQAHAVAPRLAGKTVSLNMVERHSPVFDAFFAWRDCHPGLRPTRIHLFWGKDRLRDSRPTIGVLSEVIHPLDLAAFAFGFTGFEVAGGFLHHSDFAIGEGEAVADSVHCKLRTPTGCMVSAHASFAWINRRREMFATLSDGSNAFLVHFQFDMPLWDCDSVTIHAVDPESGRRIKVMHLAFDNSHFPPDLHQLAKVHRFVTTSLATRPGRPAAPAVVGLDRAVQLQEWLDQIETSLTQTPPVAETIFPRAHAPRPVALDGLARNVAR